jgi:hypothetical protein
LFAAEHGDTGRRFGAVINVAQADGGMRIFGSNETSG